MDMGCHANCVWPKMHYFLVETLATCNLNLPFILWFDSTLKEWRRVPLSFLIDSSSLLIGYCFLSDIPFVLLFLFTINQFICVPLCSLEWFDPDKNDSIKVLKGCLNWKFPKQAVGYNHYLIEVALMREQYLFPYNMIIVLSQYF